MELPSLIEMNTKEPVASNYEDILFNQLKTAKFVHPVPVPEPPIA